MAKKTDPRVWWVASGLAAAAALIGGIALAAGSKGSTPSPNPAPTPPTPPPPTPQPPPPNPFPGLTWTKVTPDASGTYHSTQAGYMYIAEVQTQAQATALAGLITNGQAGPALPASMGFPVPPADAPFWVVWIANGSEQITDSLSQVVSMYVSSIPGNTAPGGVGSGLIQSTAGTLRTLLYGAI
jgi:hypothetical protein